MLGFKITKRNTIRQEEYLERQAKKFPKVLFYIFLVYFLVFAIYIGSYIYFTNTYALSEVYGLSMQNTLNPNIIDQKQCDDLVYVNVKKTPQRYDVIVVNDRDMSSGKPIKLIKRAIGMPGDLLTIKKDVSEGGDGYYHVYYADASTEDVYRIDENYVKSYSEWTSKTPKLLGDVVYEDEFYSNFIASGEYTTKIVAGTVFFEVPQGHIFYLGDNRARSSDSRARGTGEIKNIEGVAEIILPDAAKPDADVFGIKFKAIFSFVWNNLTEFFAR